jgi:RND family efflux transporter MFP subunit
MMEGIGSVRASGVPSGRTNLITLVNMRERMIKPVIIGCLLSVGLVVSSCGPDAGSMQVGKPPVAVEVVKASEGVTEDGLDVVGVLCPRKEVHVRTEIPAKVVEIHVSEWEPVTKGQPLATLDSRELYEVSHGTEAAFVQAAAQRKRAQREYDRAVKLYRKDVIARQVLDDAATDLETAIAAEEAARSEAALAKTRLEKMLIHSPIDGIVSARTVHVGDIAAGDTLFRIVNSDSFDLRMNVPSGRIHLVKVGQEVRFATDAAAGKTYRGTISYINPAVDEASRTVKVTAQIPNADRALRTGLFVRGRILSGTGEKMLMVPRAALRSWNMEQMKGDLFVIEGDKAVRHMVDLEGVEEGSARIVCGIEPGDPVVVRGAFLLNDGDPVIIADGKEP